MKLKSPKVADIPGISRVVHDRSPHILVVVDNTMMSPYLQKTLTLGADIEYHSATKYLSGHHDLMAGVIGCKSEAIAQVNFFSIITSTSRSHRHRVMIIEHDHVTIIMHTMYPLKYLQQKIYFVINSVGSGLGPFESFLLLRGVKTLPIRMEKQQQSTDIVAKFLVENGLKVRSH